MQNKPSKNFQLRGSQKGGGGIRHLGKIPKKYRFFFLNPPLWFHFSLCRQKFGFVFVVDFVFQFSSTIIYYRYYLVSSYLCAKNSIFTHFHPTKIVSNYRPSQGRYSLDKPARLIIRFVFEFCI